MYGETNSITIILFSIGIEQLLFTREMQSIG